MFIPIPVGYPAISYDPLLYLELIRESRGVRLFDAGAASFSDVYALLYTARYHQKIVETHLVREPNALHESVNKLGQTATVTIHKQEQLLPPDLWSRSYDALLWWRTGYMLSNTISSLAIWLRNAKGHAKIYIDCGMLPANYTGEVVDYSVPNYANPAELSLKLSGRHGIINHIYYGRHLWQKVTLDI